MAPKPENRHIWKYLGIQAIDSGRKAMKNLDNKQWLATLGYSRKNPNRGRGGGTWEYTFHYLFFYFSYPWKFQTKQLSPWIFHKIVLDPLA